MIKHIGARLRTRVVDESGAALVVVLALSITMLILISAALSFSLSGMKVADKDADGTAALAAAYAGVDEYASRLSNDSRYQRFGNPASPFTIATGSALSVSLPGAGEENPAFGLGEGASGTWAEIAGTDGRAAFRYEVDNSQYSSQGKLRVRSTGRVGSETRSVVADLKQSGFIDFLYYTVYEIMDPAISDSRCVPGFATRTGSNSATHHYRCTEIQFAGDDVLNGPVHSDDTFRICNATFNDKLTSSSRIGLTKNYVDLCGAADFQYGTGPTFDDGLGMPETNDALAKEARVDLPEIVRPGCMYTGPTTITFLSNGKVNVISPWTKYTNPSLTAGIPSENRAACGNLADLKSPAGATFTVPEQNLIWVQSVPRSTTDPNYSASSSSAEPAGFDCTGSGDAVGWKYGSSLRYPLSNERIPDSSTSDSPAYGCRNGDAYVKGVVKGQVSVASENFIYVTGDLTYADSALDVLGLVGNNAVWVWNPINTGGGAMTPDNRTIHAAILSVQHTFQVQNYNRGGDRGELKVVGAIAQLYRGTVGQGSAGYAKNYNYDKRLFSISPPKFLTPTSTTYGVTEYALVAPAFSASGATN